MSFQDVMLRGNDFLSDYPRTSTYWNYASHATCLGMIAFAKTALNVLYNPHLHHVDRLDFALAKARSENRSLLTVMNHMSVVDDPTFYAALPWRFHTDIDTIRWGFGAHNVCFGTPTLSWFFNLGKILGTYRFGNGPFQGSVDAAIRILSPDDTLDLEFGFGTKDVQKPNLIQELAASPEKLSQLANHIKPGSESKHAILAKSPFIRHKTSWFHVFPEGFVLQLESPHENSMRYFKWGVARLVLESSVAPVVVPIYTSGFEAVAPERADEQSMGWRRWLPSNVGAEIHMTFGDALPDEKIESFRAKWRSLVLKYIDPDHPTDLSEELKTGKDAQALRSEIAGYLRDQVSKVRESTGLYKPEDPRFKDPAFWKEYTTSDGQSAPDVKFVGKNWADKRLQKFLPLDE